MRQAAAAGCIGSGCFKDDAVRGAQWHGECGRSTSFIQIDVLEVREIAQVAMAHEV